MMKLYYKQGEVKNTKACLEELKKCRQLHLSAQGLEHLRYWSKQLSKVEG